MAEMRMSRASASTANFSANGCQFVLFGPAGLSWNRIHSMDRNPRRRARSRSSTSPRVTTPIRMFEAKFSQRSASLTVEAKLEMRGRKLFDYFSFSGFHGSSPVPECIAKDKYEIDAHPCIRELWTGAGFGAIRPRASQHYH